MLAMCHAVSSQHGTLCTMLALK